MKKITFSGIQPSGIIHIGNYLGAIKNWTALQNETDESYFCIVDYHALSGSTWDSKTIQETIYKNLAIYLACGLNPNKAVIFQQSDVSEHTELAWILNTQTSIGELSRMTQYKEKTEGRDSTNVGLFDYPILQAADILLYKATTIPVGDDQIQHIELTRDIARRFNNRFGKIFIEPEAYVTKAARIMALNNPEKKMSKSIDGSYITIMDSADTIKKRIMSAVTDSNKDGSGPGGKNLLLLLEQVTTDRSVYEKHLSAASNNDLSYAELKADLAEALIKFLEPIQNETNQWLAKKPELDQILASGALRARAVATQTLTQVRAVLGLSEKR